MFARILFLFLFAAGSICAQGKIKVEDANGNEIYNGPATGYSDNCPAWNGTSCPAPNGGKCKGGLTGQEKDGTECLKGLLTWLEGQPDDQPKRKGICYCASPDGLSANGWLSGGAFAVALLLFRRRRSA